MKTQQCRISKGKQHTSARSLHFSLSDRPCIGVYFNAINIYHLTTWAKSPQLNTWWSCNSKPFAFKRELMHAHSSCCSFAQCVSQSFIPRYSMHKKHPSRYTLIRYSDKILWWFTMLQGQTQVSPWKAVIIKQHRWALPQNKQCRSL